MKIVIPVSNADFHLLEPQIALEEHLDGLRGFEVVLSPSINVAGRLQSSGLVERLQMISRSVSILDTGYQETGSWPSGPNRHWARTAMALDRQGNSDPWFWKELDCWSLIPNWALRIAEDHMQGKKPFMGCIVKTPFEDKIVRDDDEMMMGCAVYRHDMSSNWEFRPILESLLNGISHSTSTADKEVPWDIMARGSFRKWGWTATDLIGDRWNTLNFRIQNGKLECDAGPTRFNNIAHKTADITKAVVIHGCKDDSLAKLVMSGAYNEFLTKSKAVASVSASTPHKAPATPKDALEALLGRAVNQEEHERFLKNLEGMLEEKTTEIRKDFPSPIGREVVVRAIETLEPTAHRSLLGKIEAILATQNIRWGKLAETLEMSKEDLKLLLEANGYSIASVSQWVKKKV